VARTVPRPPPDPPNLWGPGGLVVQGAIGQGPRLAARAMGPGLLHEVLIACRSRPKASYSAGTWAPARAWGGRYTARGLAQSSHLPIDAVKTLIATRRSCEVSLSLFEKQEASPSAVK